jgi:hypothetical protein
MGKITTLEGTVANLWLTGHLLTLAGLCSNLRPCGETTGEGLHAWMNKSYGACLTVLRTGQSRKWGPQSGSQKPCIMEVLAQP